VTPYNFNGSWTVIAPNLLAALAPFDQIDAELQVSNGVVTGTLNTYVDIGGNPPLCTTLGTVGTTLIATGTLDDAHNLTLNFPIEGGTGTILAALGDDPSTYTSGSMQVSGGTCAMSTVAVVIKGTPTVSTTNSSSPATITANLSGNWGMRAVYPLYITESLPIFGFYGALQFTNGSVTGTMMPNVNVMYGSGNCYLALRGSSGISPVSFTGTLDANNNLTLTAPFGGGTAIITATLGSNPQTWADASYQIVGGSCAISSTAMTIAQFAPVTGTYIGTFNEPNSVSDIPFAGTNVTVTAVLTQSTTPNSGGMFPITGTVNVTGACTDSASLVSGSVVYGGSVGLSAGTSGKIYLAGSNDPTGSAITYATFQDDTNFSCDTAYVGNLVRQ